MALAEVDGRSLERRPDIFEGGPAVAPAGDEEILYIFPKLLETWVAGTRMESGYPERCCLGFRTLVQQFLTRYETSLPLSDAVHPALERFVRSLDAFLDQTACLQAYSKSWRDDFDDLSVVAGQAAVICKRMADLPVGESQLIEAGHRSAGGHFCLVRVTRTSELRARVEVMNTGDGLQYHPVRTLEGKAKYACTLRYENVPLENFFSATLAGLQPSAALVKLVRMVGAPDRSERRDETPINVLYMRVLPALLEGGHIQNPGRFRTEQRSGTCATRPWTELLLNMVPEADFKNLKRELQLFAFQVQVENFERTLHTSVPPQLLWAMRELDCAKLPVERAAADAFELRVQDLAGRVEARRKRLWDDESTRPQAVPIGLHGFEPPAVDVARMAVEPPEPGVASESLRESGLRARRPANCKTYEEASQYLCALGKDADEFPCGQAAPLRVAYLQRNLAPLGAAIVENQWPPKNLVKEQAIELMMMLSEVMTSWVYRLSQRAPKQSVRSICEVEIICLAAAFSLLEDHSLEICPAGLDVEPLLRWRDLLPRATETGLEDMQAGVLGDDLVLELARVVKHKHPERIPLMPARSVPKEPDLRYEWQEMLCRNFPVLAGDYPDRRKSILAVGPAADIDPFISPVITFLQMLADVSAAWMVPDRFSIPRLSTSDHRRAREGWIFLSTAGAPQLAQTYRQKWSVPWLSPAWESALAQSKVRLTTYLAVADAELSAALALAATCSAQPAGRSAGDNDALVWVWGIRGPRLFPHLARQPELQDGHTRWLSDFLAWAKESRPRRAATVALFGCLAAGWRQWCLENDQSDPIPELERELEGWSLKVPDRRQRGLVVAAAVANRTAVVSDAMEDPRTVALAIEAIALVASGDQNRTLTLHSDCSPEPPGLAVERWCLGPTLEVVACPNADATAGASELLNERVVLDRSDWRYDETTSTLRHDEGGFDIRGTRHFGRGGHHGNAAPRPFCVHLRGTAVGWLTRYDVGGFEAGVWRAWDSSLRIRPREGGEPSINFTFEIDDQLITARLLSADPGVATYLPPTEPLGTLWLAVDNAEENRKLILRVDAQGQPTHLIFVAPDGSTRVRHTKTGQYLRPEPQPEDPLAPYAESVLFTELGMQCPNGQWALRLTEDGLLVTEDGTKRLVGPNPSRMAWPWLQHVPTSSLLLEDQVSGKYEIWVLPFSFRIAVGPGRRDVALSFKPEAQFQGFRVRPGADDLLVPDDVKDYLVLAVFAALSGNGEAALSYLDLCEWGSLPQSSLQSALISELEAAAPEDPLTIVFKLRLLIAFQLASPHLPTALEWRASTGGFGVFRLVEDYLERIRHIPPKLHLTDAELALLEYPEIQLSRWMPRGALNYSPSVVPVAEIISRHLQQEEPEDLECLVELDALGTVPVIESLRGIGYVIQAFLLLDRWSEEGQDRAQDIFSELDAPVASRICGLLDPRNLEALRTMLIAKLRVATRCPGTDVDPLLMFLERWPEAKRRLRASGEIPDLFAPLQYPSPEHIFEVLKGFYGASACTWAPPFSFRPPAPAPLPAPRADSAPGRILAPGSQRQDVDAQMAMAVGEFRASLAPEPRDREAQLEYQKKLRRGWLDSAPRPERIVLDRPPWRGQKVIDAATKLLKTETARKHLEQGNDPERHWAVDPNMHGAVLSLAASGRIMRDDQAPLTATEGGSITVHEAPPGFGKTSVVMVTVAAEAAANGLPAAIVVPGALLGITAETLRSSFQEVFQITNGVFKLDLGSSDLPALPASLPRSVEAALAQDGPTALATTPRSLLVLLLLQMREILEGVWPAPASTFLNRLGKRFKPVFDEVHEVFNVRRFEITPAGPPAPLRATVRTALGDFFAAYFESTSDNASDIETCLMKEVPRKCEPLIQQGVTMDDIERFLRQGPETPLPTWLDKDTSPGPDDAREWLAALRYILRSAWPFVQNERRPIEDFGFDQQQRPDVSPVVAVPRSSGKNTDTVFSDGISQVLYSFRALRAGELPRLGFKEWVKKTFHVAVDESERDSRRRTALLNVLGADACGSLPWHEPENIDDWNFDRAVERMAATPTQLLAFLRHAVAPAVAVAEETLCVHRSALAQVFLEPGLGYTATWHSGQSCPPGLVASRTTKPSPLEVEMQSTPPDVLPLLLEDVSGAEATDRLLNVLAQQRRPNTQALIDVGGYLLGVDIEDVAERMFNIVTGPQEPADTPIPEARVRGVLYFDDDNRITLVERDAEGHFEHVQIGSTDAAVIEKVGGIDMSALFAIYSQCNTTGVDLKLPETSHAFMTVGRRTQKHAVIQGAGRCRHLGRHPGKRSVITVLAPRDTMETVQTVGDVMSHATRVEAQAVRQDAVLGAIEELNTVLVMRLLAYFRESCGEIPVDHEIRRLLRQCLVRRQSTDPVERLKAAQLKPTPQVLMEHVERLRTASEDVLEKLKSRYSEWQGQRSLPTTPFPPIDWDKELAHVRQHAGELPPMTSGASLGQEHNVDQHLQMQTDTNVDEELKDALGPANRDPAPERLKDFIEMLQAETMEELWGREHLVQAGRVLEPLVGEEGAFFDPQLWMTRNFLHTTYRPNGDLCTTAQKFPAFMLVLDFDGGPISAVVSLAEAQLLLTSDTPPRRPAFLLGPDGRPCWHYGVNRERIVSILRQPSVRAADSQRRLLGAARADQPLGAEQRRQLVAWYRSLSTSGRENMVKYLRLQNLLA